MFVLVRVEEEDTAAGNCSTGELRLQPFSESTSDNSREGLVEICMNNAWGTVCDSLFDSLDASVACVQLGGFTGDGKNLHGLTFYSFLICVASFF